MIVIQDQTNLYENYNGKDKLEKLINYLYKNLNSISVKLELNYKFQKSVDFNDFRKYILVYYYIFYKNHIQDLILNLQKKQKKEQKRRSQIKKSLSKTKLKEKKYKKKISKIKKVKNERKKK